MKLNQKKSEREVLQKLNKQLQEKTVSELIQEQHELSVSLKSLPWFAQFFEEVEIEGYTFTTEENRYEILKKDTDNYIVYDRHTNHTLTLSAGLEEDMYILGGSFDLNAL